MSLKMSSNEVVQAIRNGQQMQTFTGSFLPNVMLMLVKQVGIRADGTGEKVGTFALAYAAHKAASPIRFPPTVALTPIVAGWFGKKPAGGDNTQPK